MHLISCAVAFVGGRRTGAQAGQGHFLLDLRGGLPVLQRSTWEEEAWLGGSNIRLDTLATMGTSLLSPKPLLLSNGSNRGVPRKKGQSNW